MLNFQLKMSLVLRSLQKFILGIQYYRLTNKYKINFSIFYTILLIMKNYHFTKSTILESITFVKYNGENKEWKLCS